MIPDLKTVVGMHPVREAGRRLEEGVGRDENVAAYIDGGQGRFFIPLFSGGVFVRGGGGVGGLGSGQAVEVTSEAGFGLDDGLAAEDDVLRSVDVGAAGDLIASFLGDVRLAVL